MSTTSKHVEAGIPPAESFVPRHVGPDEKDVAEMVRTLGFSSLDALIDATVPQKIRLREGLSLPKGMTELEVLTYFRALAAKNQVFRSFIGMGYSDCVTPPVIQRNIIEDPGWYTAYTPYQAEIAQGRLEALLNFQTMVIDLTGLEIANASLLDEATAAAEALHLIQQVTNSRAPFFVSEECHPQTIEVVKTRAEALGIQAVLGDHRRFDFSSGGFGSLVQYPTSDGAVLDYRAGCERVHGAGRLVLVAAGL